MSWQETQEKITRRQNWAIFWQSLLLTAMLYTGNQWLKRANWLSPEGWVPASCGSTVGECFTAQSR